MHTVDPRRTHRLGCELGRRVHHGHERTDSLVVLAYGSPMHRHGRYGASLFGHFASSRRIGVAAVSFGRGFASCLHRTHGHLTLAVGTSNYGSGVTNRHGRIWASMVNRANHVLHGWALGRLVTVAGGNDIEPGWRGPEATRHWINGYRAVTSTPYYNFGGAADCPPIGFCQGDWTIEDVWYAAWGSGVPAAPRDLFEHRLERRAVVPAQPVLVHGPRRTHGHRGHHVAAAVVLGQPRSLPGNQQRAEPIVVAAVAHAERRPPAGAAAAVFDEHQLAELTAGPTGIGFGGS